MKICALICAYNEQHTVEQVISNTLKFVDKLIFVNDGSTDKTLELVKSKFSNNKKIEIISWPENKGKGYASIYGFKEFLGSSTDVLVTLDADGQHDPSNIPYVILPLRPGYTDVVLGTRLGREIVYPRTRVFFNILSSIIVLLTTGGFHPDVASGFRAYTKNAIKKILPHLKAHDFSIELEILRAAELEGKIGIASVPITCKEPKKTNFGKLARAYMGFAWKHKKDILKKILIRK
jgi:glycosyltransferase involved in cell wall biosynthesis